MADFSALKTAIQANIRTNGNEEITGAILQDILLSMVTTMGDGAINALAEALQAEITNRQNAVSGEATTRAEADSGLSERINAEAQTRGEADTQLANSITAITTRLNEGYVYAGIATPSTNPGTPAGKVFYIALQAGTYTNFSSLVVTQGITILKYNGTAWSQDNLLAIDNVPKKNGINMVTSGGIFANIGAFDISEYHKSDSTLATYADLSAALAALPSDFQKGGMSIKFVQSSDNKYVQFRLMADSFSTTVSDWQGVDDNTIGDSPNLVKNGAVVYGIDGAYITGLSPYSAGRAQKQLEVNTVKAGKHYFLVSEVPSEWSNATVGLRLVKAMTLNSSDLIVKMFDYITGSACLNNIYEVTLTQEQASQVVGVIFSLDNTDTGAIGKTIKIKWWDESGRLYFEDSTKKDLVEVHESINEVMGKKKILSFSGDSRLTRVAYDFQNGKKYDFRINNFVYEGYETFNISLLSNPSWNTANRVQNIAYNITEGGYFYFECNVSNAHYIAIRGNEDPEESYSISFDAEVYEAVHSEFYVNNVELMIKRNIFSISHQGYSMSMNTGKCIASNYINLAKYGFDCGECDVQWTSDNVPVCCHDDSFTDSITGDVVVISEHTYTELLTYSYYGTKISSLEDVIKACKVAGIEIQLDKVHYSWTDTQYEIIFALLRKYGMSSKTTWYYIYDSISSFAQKVLTFEPSSKLYFPVTLADTSKIETINGLVNDKNIILVGNSTTNLSVSNVVSLRDLLDSRIKIGVGTIDVPDTFRSYLEVVDCITSNKISESLYRVRYMA